MVNSAAGDTLLKPEWQEPFDYLMNTVKHKQTEIAMKLQQIQEFLQLLEEFVSSPEADKGKAKGIVELFVAIFVDHDEETRFFRFLDKLPPEKRIIIYQELINCFNSETKYKLLALTSLANLLFADENKINEQSLMEILWTILGKGSLEWHESFTFPFTATYQSTTIELIRFRLTKEYPQKFVPILEKILGELDQKAKNKDPEIQHRSTRDLFDNIIKLLGECAFISSIDCLQLTLYSTIPNYSVINYPERYQIANQIILALANIARRNSAQAAKIISILENIPHRDFSEEKRQEVLINLPVS